MNTEIYSKLLITADKLIQKHPFLILNKYDLVHECWDFETNEFKQVCNKMYSFFYTELMQTNIHFSGLESRGFSLDHLNISIPKKYKDSHKQCAECGDVLPVETFKYDKKTDYHLRYCAKCEYALNRESSLQRTKKYQQTSENYKAKRRIKRQQLSEEEKEKRREYRRNYYKKNREDICAHRRDKFKNGEWNDRTAHERYLRFKNKRTA